MDAAQGQSRPRCASRIPDRSTRTVHPSFIKGTGEASPVRGRDWAGFKFAAK